MAPLLDPRRGDIEDDASSTKRRSLLGIAGSLLAEISLPKLLTAWLLLVVLPGVLLGVAPLVASGWLATLSGKMATLLDELWPLLLFVLLAVLGGIGGRPLFRAAEQGFSVASMSWSSRPALRSAARRSDTWRGTSDASARRRRPHAPGCRDRGRCRAHSLRRGPGRGGAGVAGHPLDRWHLRPGRTAPAGGTGTGQRRRPPVRLSGGGVPGLGDRRRADGSAARSCGIRPAAARWPVVAVARLLGPACRSASATAFASRAGAPVHAATAGWRACWRASMPFTPSGPSTSSSLRATRLPAGRRSRRAS